MAQNEVDPRKKKEDLAAAIDYFTASVRIVGTVLAVSALGSAYVQSDRYEDALWFYEQALRAKPAHPEVMNNVEFIAEQSTEKGDLDLAVKAYDILIAKKPCAAWYAALGMIYGKDLGDLAKAEEVLVQGVSNRASRRVAQPATRYRVRDERTHE